MKKIEKLDEMIEDDPLWVAYNYCPSNYGIKSSSRDHCCKDTKSCYHCWMEEVEEVEE